MFAPSTIKIGFKGVRAMDMTNEGNEGVEPQGEVLQDKYDVDSFNKVCKGILRNAKELGLRSDEEHNLRKNIQVLNIGGSLDDDKLDVMNDIERKYKSDYEALIKLQAEEQEKAKA